MKIRQRWIGWTVAALALAGVFVLYTRADFLVQLSNELWACF